MVSLAEALGQEDLAAVMVLRGVDRGLVVELERDHEVGREAAGELRRADDGVAAVGALGDSRGLVRDGLGSAGRADVGVSEAGCGVGIELCRGDRIGGFGLLLRLLLRVELLDLPDGELRVAVVADEKPLAAVVAQRTPTGGALVVDALESHNRPPLLEGQRTVRHERRRARLFADMRLAFGSSLSCGARLRDAIRHCPRSQQMSRIGTWGPFFFRGNSGVGRAIESLAAPPAQIIGCPAPSHASPRRFLGVQPRASFPSLRNPYVQGQVQIGV